MSLAFLIDSLAELPFTKTDADEILPYKYKSIIASSLSWQ